MGRKLWKAYFFLALVLTVAALTKLYKNPVSGRAMPGEKRRH
jgi:hypothetical protein